MKNLARIAVIVALALFIAWIKGSTNPLPAEKPKPTPAEAARQAEEQARKMEAFKKQQAAQHEKEMQIYAERTKSARHMVHDDEGRLVPGETELNDRWFTEGKPGLDDLRKGKPQAAQSAAWPDRQPH